MTEAEPSSQRAIDMLWYTRCPVPTAFSLAINPGWLDEEFAGEGVRVASLRHAPDRKTPEAHFDHSLEDSFRYGGNIPPISAHSQGADTRLIGLAWIDAPHVILTPPESGIRTVRA